MFEENPGWIKLHRKILQWEWYDDMNATRVFLHLLLTVNFEDGRWHGIIIKRGQRIISVSKLAKECRLTRDQVRAALIHLQSTHEVHRLPRGNFSLFTVLKYNDYQQHPQRIPNESPTTPHNIRRKEEKEYNTPLPPIGELEKKLVKYLGQFPSVDSPAGMAKSLLKKFGEKILTKAILNPNCTGTAHLYKICEQIAKGGEALQPLWKPPD